MAGKKRTKNSTKSPELSISDKINHYKGYNRTLRKRLENLEQRLYELEQRMNKYKHLLPDECIKPEKEKNIEPDTREDFNKKFNPKFRNKDE